MERRFDRPVAAGRARRALASIGEPSRAQRCGARAEERAVRARVAAVAVDGPPDRLERVEQLAAGRRIGFGGQPGEDGQPVEPSPTRPERRGRRAIAPGECAPARGGPPAPRRSRRRRPAARRASAPSSSSQASDAAHVGQRSRVLVARVPRRRARRAPRRRRAVARGSVARAPGRPRPDRRARRGPRDDDVAERGQQLPEGLFDGRDVHAARRIRGRPPAAVTMRDAHPIPRWRHDRHRLAVPADHRPGQGPHRLRDVPGQPERVDPQPHPVRVRAARARRRPLDPRPSRPLRAAAAAGQGRLSRPIHATAGTVELATLVLLDSGKLHEEFAKREARWEKRHPDQVAADDRREADEYQAALDLAAARRGRHRGATVRRPDGASTSPTTIEPAPPAWPPTPRPSSAPSRRTSRSTSTRRSTPPRTPSGRSRSSRPSTTAPRSRSRPGSTPRSRTPGTSSARRSSGCASRTTEGGEERVDRLLRRPRPARARRSCATRRR